jgi:hypothetical protein
VNSSEEGNLAPKPFHDESVVNASQFPDIANTNVIRVRRLKKLLGGLEEESFAFFPRTTRALWCCRWRRTLCRLRWDLCTC